MLGFHKIPRSLVHTCYIFTLCKYAGDIIIIIIILIMIIILMIIINSINIKIILILMKMMIIVRHACLAHGVPLHRAPSLPSAGLMLMYCIIIIIAIIAIIIIFVIIINIIIIIIVSVLHIAIIIPLHRQSLGQFLLVCGCHQCHHSYWQHWKPPFVKSPSKDAI